jgi:hypothetical protein
MIKLLETRYALLWVQHTCANELSFVCVGGGRIYVLYV